MEGLGKVTTVVIIAAVVVAVVIGIRSIPDVAGTPRSAGCESHEEEEP